jgi:hypothetical protein
MRVKVDNIDKTGWLYFEHPADQMLAVHEWAYIDPNDTLCDGSYTVITNTYWGFPYDISPLSGPGLAFGLITDFDHRHTLTRSAFPYCGETAPDGVTWFCNWGETLPGIPPGETYAVRNAPMRSISRYVSTTNTARWYDLGCQYANAVRAGTRPFNSLVVLAFGAPRYNGINYGTLAFDNAFRSTAQIRGAAYNFGYGFYVCTGPINATLDIGIGTSNNGSSVTYDHGRAWAQMVNATVNQFIDNCCIISQVIASGAIDAELGWSGPTATRAWVNGYESANQQWLYNFGDAAGCPPYGSCQGGWTTADVYYISWGNPSSWAVPQIYNETAAQARQWQRISLHAYKQTGFIMDFLGSMAQWQACQDKNLPCSGLNNTAGTAWTQLRNELNRDWRTGDRPDYSTDISWSN